MAAYLLEGEKSNRLLFRRLEQGDLTSWLPFFTDPDLPSYWNFDKKDPLAACEAFFERVFHRYDNGLGGLNALCRVEDSTLIGVSGLLVQEIDGTKVLEVAYSLLPRFRGCGYASEAAAFCVKKAFQSGWATELISMIHPENKASRKVALRNGFHKDTIIEHQGAPYEIYRIFKGDGAW